MKIYKPTYKDKKTGQIKKCENWYLTFTDNKDVRRRLPAFPFKDQTYTAAEKIKELLASGGVLSQDLQRWIENLPQKMQNNLIRFGLIDSQRISGHLNNTLAEHIEDFYKGLLAKGNGGRYAGQVKKTVNKIFADCGFKVLSDIDANKVITYLADLRDKSIKSIGQRTFNCYLKAAKQFCRWLIKERRTTINLLEHLEGMTQTEKRRIRRALTLDEQKKLLEAAVSGKKHHNLTGYERYLVYVLALQTGLRANEIRSLTVSSFDFTNCRVILEQAYTKNKKTADICLKQETAAELKAYFANKMPQVKAFAFPNQPSKMIIKDLKAAGIPYKTDEGTADFHSLRHDFITGLALQGVYPADAMVLARHSTITLTMNHYTHVRRESTKRIIESQPDLTAANRKNLTVAC